MRNAWRSLLAALLCLLLPWIWLGGMRYLPVGRWFRAAACFLATGLWAYLAPWVLDRIMLASGFIGDQPYSLWLQVDFSNWQDVAVRAQNILLLIYIGFGLLSLLCLAIGLWRRKH